MTTKRVAKDKAEGRRLYRPENEEEMKDLTIYKVSLVKDRTIEYIPSAKSSDDVYEIAKVMGLDTSAEEFMGVICLNTNGNMTSYHEVSHGDLSSSAAHPREIFKRAILSNSAAIILVHNHPNGNVTPSLTDIETTKRMMQAGEILGITVLDHIIVGDDTYHSMKSCNEM